MRLVTFVLLFTVTLSGARAATIPEMFRERLKSVVAVEFLVQTELERRPVFVLGTVADAKGTIILPGSAIANHLAPSQIKDFKVYRPNSSESFTAEYLGQDPYTGWHFLRVEEKLRSQLIPITSYTATVSEPAIGEELWGIGLRNKEEDFAPYFQSGKVGTVVRLPQKTAIMTADVAGPGLPVGIRLGSRRALAESTAAALASAMEELTTGSAGSGGSLPDARAAFEARAAPVRAFLREQAESQKAGATETERRRTLERRAATLREELARTSDAPPPPVELANLDAAAAALREHAEAAARLAPIHLDGKAPSIKRAIEKWARANALRAPRIEPVLVALGLGMPFGDLDRGDPREDIARQHAAIEATLASLADARSRLTAPALRSELGAVTAELGVVAKGPTAPPLDPALYDAALALRDAWARAHRDVLLPRLATARDAARAEWTEARGKPVPLALRELAALFPLAGCTLLSMRASFQLGADVIDRLVIDEAAQCAPIYAVPALARARRVMLTGDLAQLPPVYTLAAHTDDRLARGLDEAAVTPFRMGVTSTASAQAVAEPRARARLALTEHFRSQHAIVALASRWSGYTLDVRTPPRSLEDLSPRLSQPVIVLPVPGVGARAPEGVVNEAEAAVAIALVAELVADGVAPSDIAVLTPFVGQSVRIERELVARGLLARDGVLVSTVHRLQGGERRVVVFSVTATERRHLRWLAEHPHLLHVATSRAQDHLIVLLDPTASAREPSLAPLAELLAPA